MRNIEVKSWQAKDEKGNEVKEDTLMLLNILINNVNPKELPRGLDKFRTFNRLGKAFINAEESKILKIEEGDYIFLKKIVETNIPSNWGMNEDINNAIELILDAKQE